MHEATGQPAEIRPDACEPAAPAAKACLPTALLVLPWNPDEIGGVSEVVVNLHRLLSAMPRFRPRLLVDAYPYRNFRRDIAGTIGRVDLFHVPAVPGRGKGIYHFAAFAGRLPLALYRLVTYLRRENVRAINIHYPTIGAASLLLARSLADSNVPVVLSFHGSDLKAVHEAGPLHRRIWTGIIARCDAVVACSRALADEIAHCFPDVGRKLHVVHNGVDGAACREAHASAALPSELRDRRFIACVATFEEKKGQDVLLAGFRTVARAVPALCLALVGRSGPTLDSLRAAAADEALDGRVFLFPDHDHAGTLAVMAAADLLVLPSRQEPFGIVILEAASLGIPVVASRVGGIPEIIEDRRSGILVPPDDVAALRDAILAMLRDPGLARRYAARLRAAAEARFTWRQATERYLALFSLVRRRGTAPHADGAPHSAH